METLKVLKVIIYLQVLGEVLYKCIKIKDYGNKLLDAQNFMEKINTHAN